MSTVLVAEAVCATSFDAPDSGGERATDCWPTNLQTGTTTAFARLKYVSVAGLHVFIN
jgi:hypothetical protein